MSRPKNHRARGILLVEDNAGDICLMQELLNECGVTTDLTVARDGEEALARLRREGPYAGASRPDLILLDLNLPRKTGHEVLSELKADPALRRIPVVVLTMSSAERDITRSYDLHASCYINKPLQLNEFIEVVESIRGFWLRLVRFPH